MHSTMNLGGSVVSKNILEKRGRLKWCFREESVNNIDNGWRFLSEIDTDEFLADSGFALTEACDCNMLEEQETPLPVEGNEIRLTIRPFEIRTLRLRFN